MSALTVTGLNKAFGGLRVTRGVNLACLHAGLNHPAHKLMGSSDKPPGFAHQLDFSRALKRDQSPLLWGPPTGESGSSR